MTVHNTSNNSGINPQHQNFQINNVSNSTDLQQLNSSNFSAGSTNSPNTLGLQSGTISQIQPTSGGTAPTKATRPKSFYQWSVVDVQKWLRRHCGDYYHLYSEAFLEQDITGRSLMRLNENSLLRLGVVHPEHRQEILRKITQQRLKTNIVLLKDMNRRQQNEEQNI